MKLCTELQHPVQSGLTATASGASKKTRFFETGKLDLNATATLNFPDEDRCQLAQLLGYSVSGYGDLSFAQRRPGHVHAMDILADEANKGSTDLTPEQAENAALKQVVEAQRAVLQRMKALLDQVDCCD
jgi:hypothetical protein